MKSSRFFLSIAVCAMAVVSIGAQAAGIDVPGFIATHQDIFAGLSMLALAGEVKDVDPEAITRELQGAHHALVAAITADWWRATLMDDATAGQRLALPAGLAAGDRWQRK